MKKIMILLASVLLLTGCSAKTTFETVSDDPGLAVNAQAAQILVELPDDLLEQVFSGDTSGHIYIGEDYTVTVQTLPAGDLDATLRSCTGFARDALTVMETEKYGLKAYSCTWSAAGEGTNQIGRLQVLDDGAFHYVLCVMADADKAGDLAQTWQELFDSFRVETDPVSTVT